MALVAISGAFWACGGDDTMGSGSGGSGGGTGGSGGTSATGGSADSGRDTGSGGANDGSADVRADTSSGGSGGTGTGGATGSGGSDAGRDGSTVEGGIGGGDGAAGSDAQREASLPDASPDAPRADAGPDGATTRDATPDTTTSDVSDAGSPTTNDAGPEVVDANDAQAPPNDVTDDQAHAACTALPAGASMIFGYDMSTDANWTFDPNNNPTPHPEQPPPQATMTPAWDNLDGCSAPGEVKFTIPFDFDAAIIQGAVFNADLGDRDLTGRTAVHISIKVETPAGLQFVSPFLQVNRPDGFLEHDGSHDYVAANLGVGVWTDLVIPLPPPDDAGPLTASSLGLQVFSIVPGVTVFDIDSVWVE
jgi:hypothetical protein